LVVDYADFGHHFRDERPGVENAAHVGDEKKYHHQSQRPVHGRVLESGQFRENALVAAGRVRFRPSESGRFVVADQLEELVFDRLGRGPSA